MSNSSSLLKISIGCLALGIGLAVIGGCSGGIAQTADSEVLNRFAAGNITELFEEWRSDRSPECRATYSFETEENTNVLRIEESFKAENIENLFVQADAAKISLGSSEDEQFHVNVCAKQKVEVYEENNTLYIHCDEIKADIKRLKNTIEVEIPQNHRFEEVTWNIGAGVLECENGLNCKTVNLNLGAGRVTAAGLRSTEQHAEVGAGELILTDCLTQDGTYSIGMGSMKYAGDVTGDLAVKCAMGSVYMDMESEQAQHNASLSVSAGSGNIGTLRVEGAGEKHAERNTDSDYNASCSMGEIRIEFAE